MRSTMLKRELMVYYRVREGDLSFHAVPHAQDWPVTCEKNGNITAKLVMAGGRLGSTQLIELQAANADLCFMGIVAGSLEHPVTEGRITGSPFSVTTFPKGGPISTLRLMDEFQDERSLGTFKDTLFFRHKGILRRHDPQIENQGSPGPTTKTGLQLLRKRFREIIARQ